MIVHHLVAWMRRVRTQVSLHVLHTYISTSTDAWPSTLLEWTFAFHHSLACIVVLMAALDLANHC